MSNASNPINKGTAQKVAKHLSIDLKKVYAALDELQENPIRYDSIKEARMVYVSEESSPEEKKHALAAWIHHCTTPEEAEDAYRNTRSPHAYDKWDQIVYELAIACTDLTKGEIIYRQAPNASKSERAIIRRIYVMIGQKQ